MIIKRHNMSALRVILGDQLSIPSREDDLILMCEVLDEVTYVKYHKKKIAFLFSAMRHFAKELRESGYRVQYVKFDDESNSGSFKGEIARILKNNNKIDKIITLHPGEFRVLEDIKSWEREFNIPVEIIQDDRFLCSTEEFSSWVNNRTQLRMENFYHYMRKKYSILMDGDDPIGGKWNYDSENRKPPKAEMRIPSRYEFKPDDITQEVIDLVATRFSDHFGDLEPFYFAVTREQALAAFNQFIMQSLKNFGPYQDAMIEGEPFVYHSCIGIYLNCGLLLPMECIKAVEKAYHDGKVDLNSAEGFIRQILGWREYVRGIYWLKMPQYKKHNFLDAKRKLPWFYWTANTKMNCIKQCVKQTKELAYAHHIQRLMVLGNFALIAGIHPDFVNEWFLIVYADAYEWVELPNVTGMILFADGGYLASKPYASSGAYINKMSNYCKNCSYKVEQKNGPSACPFNYLYWNFLAVNREKLSTNHRMSIMYKVYSNMEESRKVIIAKDSEEFLAMIDKEQI